MLQPKEKAVTDVTPEGTPSMSFTADKLLLFGATGDLSQRMLLPSLCALHADALVPKS
jgi:glucose-6-phosphate 1-dehydrogenase